MKKRYIGGQALIEGVMMLNKEKNKYCSAVRKGKKIIIKKEKLKFKEPNIFFIRGIVNLIVMLYIGIKTLNYSTNVSLDKAENKTSFWEIFLGLIFAIIFGIAIFKFLPLLFTTWFDKSIAINNVVFNVIEGILKVIIFVLYVYLISLIKDVHRVFRYHGAEHKTVWCYEAGEKLTIKNVRRYKKEHKRCGTSFIFLVLIVSILVYSFIPKDFDFGLKLALRVILLPVIAGISYELLRAGARYKWFEWLSYPGIWIQKITTKEPDRGMIEVAIKALKGAL